MHELRYGELAHFKLIPHTPYYGTADATILYLIVFHMAWRATGASDLLERHLVTAERCLEWIDKYGDRDGDGFQEYRPVLRRVRKPGMERCRRSGGQSGRYVVKGPKALCELQGYVYDAWLRRAEMCE